MTLSDDCVLFFVLRQSGVVGHLTSGRVEQEGEGLAVYDYFGNLNEYISGTRMRSWCVVRARRHVPEWSQIMPEDVPLLPRGQ
jgi:hypothetical protein